MQHSLEVVGTAVFDFAVVYHAAGVDAVVWETVDAELVCAVPVADTVACSDVEVDAGVVLECTVDTVLDAPVRCTLCDIGVVSDCSVCCCGVGTAFAVAY